MTKKAQVIINILSLIKRELEKFTSSIPGKDNMWQTQTIAVLQLHTYSEKFSQSINWVTSAS